MKIFLLALLISCTLLSCKQEDTITNNINDTEPQLLLYMPFNGNAHDESGNGNNASAVHATLTTDRFGTPSSAYHFNGIDDYIVVQNSASLSGPSKSISICAWVYVEDWYKNNWAPILVKSNTSAYGMYGMQLINFTDRRQFEVHLNHEYRNLDCSFDRLRWYFLVFTWDGTTCRYYIDGGYSGQKSYSGILATDRVPLLIGIDPPELTEYLNGKLDEIRIYDKAISQHTIDSLYALNH